VVSTDANVRPKEAARPPSPRRSDRPPRARGGGWKGHGEGGRPGDPVHAGGCPVAGGRARPAGLPGVAEGPGRAGGGEEEPGQAPLPAQLGEGHRVAGAGRPRTGHRPGAPRRRPRPLRALPVLGGGIRPRVGAPAGRPRVEGRCAAGCVARRRHPTRGRRRAGGRREGDPEGRAVARRAPGAARRDALRPAGIPAFAPAHRRGRGPARPGTRGGRGRGPTGPVAGQGAGRARPRRRPGTGDRAPVLDQSRLHPRRGLPVPAHRLREAGTSGHRRASPAACARPPSRRARRWGNRPSHRIRDFACSPPRSSRPGSLAVPP